MERLVGLPCTIRPGAFSGERIFTLYGVEDYQSMAPRSSFYTADNALPPGDDAEEAVDGFLIGRLVEPAVPGGASLIVLPDGGAIERTPDLSLDEKVPRGRSERVPV